MGKYLLYEGSKFMKKILDTIQSLFKEEVYSISEHKGLYYVTLEGNEFIKPVYEVDISKMTKVATGMPLPILESYDLVYSKFKYN